MFLSSIGLPWTPKTRKPRVPENPRETWLVRRPLKAPIQTLKGISVQGHRAHKAPSLKYVDGAGTKTVPFPVFSEYCWIKTEAMHET